MQSYLLAINGQCAGAESLGKGIFSFCGRESTIRGWMLLDWLCYIKNPRSLLLFPPGRLILCVQLEGCVWGAELRQESAAKQNRKENRNKWSAPGPGVSHREGFSEAPATLLYFYLPAALHVWQIHSTSSFPQLTCNETN